MLIIPVINWLEATHNYKVVLALFSSEQRQSILLDDEPLEDVDNPSTSVWCSSQTARTPRRSETVLILPVPHSLAYNPAVCSRWDISLRSKSRVYDAAVCSILPYGCQTWPAQVTNERMPAVFGNGQWHWNNSYLQICWPRFTVKCLTCKLSNRNGRQWEAIARLKGMCQVAATTRIQAW